ncbi:MAG TPA: class I SAM-dependent methyltransferase [Croceibacterium sp.]|nr:class I SAM-dependent methyltransferase [Croceibacterium sp.]
MTDAFEWQGRVGANWAAQWRRTDRSFAPLTERLLQRSREFAFGPVLDIGCGAGELALAIARGRPHSRVVGVDISPHLVATARERGVNLANASFEVADAAVWQPEPGFAPELLVSRHGVMFFDEPHAAFVNLARIAAPGAGLMFSCFREMKDNPLFSEVSRLLPPSPAPSDPHAPGPFAFADASYVEALLGGAGWHGVAFEPFDLAMVVGAGPDPVDDALAYFASIGPAARALAEMPPEQAEPLLDGLRTLARRHVVDRMVALRAATWIVTAHKA